MKGPVLFYRPEARAGCLGSATAEVGSPSLYTDGLLHASGSTREPDPDAILFHDDRDSPRATSILQHLFECLPVAGYIQILDRNLFPFIVLTGSFGVRSSIFPEDKHFFLHKPSIIWIT